MQLEDEFEAVDSVDSVQRAVPATDEAVTEEISPILQDCLMDSKLHLTGFEEAETLTVALSEVADTSDRVYFSTRTAN